MKKALAVVDMQHDFIDGALGTKEAVAIVPGVIEKIKGFDGEIIFTQDTHLEDYAETQEGRKLPVKHCVKGEPGWEIPKEILAAADGKKITTICKPTFGSVISNAMVLKAFCPELELVVDGSCCAGVTPESHETALRAMQACQIEVN